MAKPLSLPTIQALADDTPYGGTRVLASLSAATILSAANWLSDFDNWEGAGINLTTDEKDEIDALVGELVNDVLVEGAPDMGNFVKLYEVVHTEDVVYPYISDMDTSDYNRIKIYVSGLLTDSTVSWGDYARVALNGDVTGPPYNMYTRVNTPASTWDLQTLETTAGFRSMLMAASDSPVGEIFGNGELTIYNNISGTNLHVQGTAMVGGDVSNEMVILQSTGLFGYPGPLTQITLLPEAGTTFLVDPEDDDEPNELRITVYGLD